MSAKRPELTPELLRRILPALRMMARFQTKPAKVVSFETGIDLTDIYAYTEAKGRPKPKDVETIERELADGIAPKLVKVQRVAEAPVAPPVVTEKRVAPAALSEPAKVPAAPVRPFTPTPDDQPWLNRRLQGKTLRLYTPVVAWLIEHPRERAAAACREFKCDESAFSAWRIGVFGHSLPGTEMFARFVAWANEQLVRRGEPKLGIESICASAITTPPAEAPRHPPPEAPRHTREDSARNGAAEPNPEAAVAPDVVTALTGLRDRYVAELDRLQKTLAGVERAIECTRAKIEAAEECVAIAKGGAS